MSTVIELRDLTKYYGQRPAVNGLNLDIAAGEIFGFVGPNGAGKTSTLRMIATLLEPSRGDAYVDGCSVRREPRQVRQAIGYMPDFFGAYQDMKVWEYLDFFAACYEIPVNQRPRLINDLLDLVDLSARREDNVDRLSRGMKQRLSLARTLVHDPRVLLLDEPASGLDPRARVEIRELLVELASMGKTVFFSTHILADVAEICTRIGILEAGRLVAVGTLEELQSQVMPRRRIEVTVLDGLDQAHGLLSGTSGVQSVLLAATPPGTLPQRQTPEMPEELLRPFSGPRRGSLHIEFSGDDAALSGLLAKLVSAGIPVIRFNEDQKDLEEVFLRATKGIVS